MRREIILHFGIFLIVFLIVSLLRGYFQSEYIFFWLGGLIGTALPDIDHVIHTHIVSPQELTSQRVKFYLNKREIMKTMRLFYDTRSERKGLIFHSFFFQCLFIAFTVFILTSSASLFGRGISFAFLLHLVVDQYIDIKALGNLDNWQAPKYWLPISVLLVLVLALLL